MSTLKERNAFSVVSASTLKTNRVAAPGRLITTLTDGASWDKFKIEVEQYGNARAHMLMRRGNKDDLAMIFRDGNESLKVQHDNHASSVCSSYNDLVRGLNQEQKADYAELGCLFADIAKAKRSASALANVAFNDEVQNEAYMIAGDNIELGEKILALINKVETHNKRNYTSFEE